MPDERNCPAARRWGLACGLALALGGGCTTTRVAVDEVVLAQRRQTLITDQEELLHGVTDKLVARMEGRGAGDPALDVLIISGGGDWGAFGAGFLAGWGQVGDPRFKRPAFDMVCGVSTGALIAPFAFAGDDRSYERVEWLYRHPAPDLVTLRDWFSWLPWRPSFMSNDGIRVALKNAVSRGLVRKVADRSRDGGVLLVATTSLDHGSMVMWDLGTECERAAESGDRGRVLSVLLASTAIPATFPPVSLDNGLYADGGITSVGLLDSDCYDADGLVTRWRERSPSGRSPLVRYWVLMNLRVRAPSMSVEPNWSSVADAALCASIRSSAWLQARLMAAQLDYINAKGWARCELRTVSIPEDWRPTVEGDFQAKTMNELADLGRRMGADTGSWRLLTLPKE